MSSKSMLDPIIRALVGVDPKHHGLILDIINKLSGRDGDSFRSRVLKVLRENSASTYLSYLNSVTLAPAKGCVTIAESSDVFTGHLDPNFEKWGTNVAGYSSLSQKIDIHEIKKGGVVSQFFNSLDKPRSLCLTQGQIVEFCRSNRNELDQGGCRNYFLFEESSELFVVSVRIVNRELVANLYRFGHCGTWDVDYNRCITA